MWWLGAGYAAGLGTAAWMRNKVRRTAERYAPEQVRQAVVDRSRAVSDRARQAVVDRSRAVGDRARQAVVGGSSHLGREARRVAQDLREAATEGRDAMRRTEGDLRDQDRT